MKTYDQGKIDFVGKIKFFTVFSTFAVLGSIALILARGLNYGIDFAGGTEIQVKFASAVDEGAVRKFLSEVGLDAASVQRLGDQNEVLIRVGTATAATEEESNRLQNELTQKVTAGIQSTFASSGPEIRRVDSVGPQVGSQLKRNGLLASFYALVMILIYVGLRFDYKFAPGAVLCLVHDAVVTVGAFALLGKEVNIQILAAVLTIIGYSINDTIVIYDKIRELVQEDPTVPMRKIINRATNDMLSRTILTSATVLVALVALYAMAGGVIEDFAFAMMVGVVAGAYSTIYIASPLIILIEETMEKQKRKKATAA